MTPRARVLGTVFAAYLLVLLAPGVLSAGEPPKDMRPMVFLLLDTSGSMEYTLDAATEENPFPLPDCPTPPPPGFEYTRNRWITAVEVLTGSFEGLSCQYDDRTNPAREDFGYPLPHVDWSYTEQADDGLLDLLREDISFGLMTFDPITAPDTDASGGWSFYYDAPVGELNGDPVEIGIKNDGTIRGGLVHPSNADTVGALLARNSRVQDRIRAAIPHWGAPTGAALDDLSRYLQREQSLQPQTADNPDGDPFAACRPKTVVLLTDGAPGHDGQYGYPTANVAAERLRVEFGVSTFVVGLAVHDAQERAALDQVAYHGGTGQAHFAANSTQLRGLLASVFAETVFAVESRARAVATESTRNYTDRQYRLYSGRAMIPLNPVDREGILEQEIWGCDPACYSEDDEDGAAGLCEIFDLGQVLNERSASRNLYTVLTDPAGGGVVSVEDFRVDNSALTYESLGFPPSPDGEYNHVAMFFTGEDWVLPFGYLIGEQPDGTIPAEMTEEEKQIEYVRQLIEFIHGDPGSRRVDHRLGAIYRSTPAIQTAPSPWRSTMGSYRYYAHEHRDRPTVLYVSTHDGVLHAFRIDRDEELSRADYGEELWGFIPGFARERLYQLDSTAVQIGDGSPIVAEVLPRRDDVAAEVGSEAALWQSVLLLPSGGGGRGLVALDVTEPSTWRDEMFMWELTPEGRCYGPGNGNCESNAIPASDFSGMGYQTARPIIGRVYVRHGMASLETTVVAFAGGQDPDETGTMGRSFYIVDVSDGSKIVEFSDENGNVEGGSLSAFPLVGSPVGYSTSTDRMLTRVFIGDAGGRLWRLSIRSDQPGDWRLKLFHDAYEGQPLDSPARSPILYPPSLASSPHYNRLVVIYTTGGLDDDGNGVVRRIVSLQETTDEEDVIAVENWDHSFEEDEKPVGQVVVFNRVAYFTSYVPQDDACNIGVTRLWGVDYRLEEDSELVPRMAPEGDPFASDPPVLYIEIPDTTPLGVSLMRRPSCLFTSPEFDQPLPPGAFGAPGEGVAGDAGLGSYELVVQEAAGTAGPGSPSPPPGSPGAGESRIPKSVGVPVSAPALQILLHSWTTVFE